MTNAERFTNMLRLATSGTGFTETLSVFKPYITTVVSPGRVANKAEFPAPICDWDNVGAILFDDHSMLVLGTDDARNFTTISLSADTVEQSYIMADCLVALYGHDVLAQALHTSGKEDTNHADLYAS